MRVYSVYIGERYRQRELIGIYSKSQKALEVAVALLSEQKGKWWPRNLDKDETGIIRAWQSTWEEIIVYEHEVI